MVAIQQTVSKLCGACMIKATGAFGPFRVTQIIHVPNFVLIFELASAAVQEGKETLGPTSNNVVVI